MSSAARCRELPFRLPPVWVALLALSLASCSHDSAPPPAPPVPVRVATVEQRSVPVELDAIGTVTPVSNVTVRSQVEGSIATVDVQEGREVEVGALLFTLDPRPFEAALAQARANLERARAQAANSRADAARQHQLFAAGVASKEVLDTARTQARVDAGAVGAAEAAVRTAELDLEHTRIQAPIRGRAGSLLVHEGDVVKANDTPLVELNQIAPIDVRFTVPEQRLPAVQAALAAGPVAVGARPGGSGGEAAEGTLQFVDNAVDSTTGTIALKARFANDARRLWPGQFVDVVLRIGERANAIVVPDQAVQAGQDGPVAFVIDAHDHAQLRPVRVDFSRGGETVVASGLSPGERVVVDGQLRLSPDAPVRIEAAPAKLAGPADPRS